MNRDAKSRHAVLQASASVLSANPGASLTQIAEEAGVGRATLYRHFSSRSELVRALALESIREIDEATADLESRATSARHALELVCSAVVPLGERYHFLIQESELAGDPELAEQLERQLDETKELIDMAKAEGSIAPDVPTVWVVAALDALVYGAWTAVSDGSVARNEAAGLVFRTLLDGLSPRKEGNE